MSDAVTTIKRLKEVAQTFIDQREWSSYHSPKSLSMNIAIEAAELMEKFVWITTQESHDQMHKNRQEIEDELADVFFSVLCFANAANIDLSKAFERKLKEIDQKYPIEKSKGKATKYTDL